MKSIWSVDMQATDDKLSFAQSKWAGKHLRIKWQIDWANIKIKMWEAKEIPCNSFLLCEKDNVLAWHQAETNRCNHFHPGYFLWTGETHKKECFYMYKKRTRHPTSVTEKTVHAMYLQSTCSRSEELTNSKMFTPSSRSWDQRVFQLVRYECRRPLAGFTGPVDGGGEDDGRRTRAGWGEGAAVRA